MSLITTERALLAEHLRRMARTFVMDSIDRYRLNAAAAEIDGDPWVPIVQAPRGDMFIWARPKRDGRNPWALGLAYWTRSGTWADSYGSPLISAATHAHLLPTPPKG